MFALSFNKRHPEVGARPGTLVIPEQAPKPKIRLISYSQDGVNDVDLDSAAGLQEAFHESSVTWVDVQGFGDQPLIEEIGDVFDLHPLLLEDIVNVPQRPKVEAYGDQVLVIVRMVSTTGSGEIDIEQVSVVMGKNYVLTFQERYGDVLDPVRNRIHSGSPRIRGHGTDFLTYAIVDTIVDGYYPVMESIGDHLESLEDQVMANPTPELLMHLHRTKNRLVNLRRSIWPQRESLNTLVREEELAISEEVRVFLRDTRDHCVQTSEVAEMYREMVTGLMNTYLSSMANRTNEVMKVLTIMASIFIPLTFLAGIYGMNFDHMPELHSEWGYPAIWVAMVVTAVGMTSFFYFKGWIGGPPKPK